MLSDIWIQCGYEKGEQTKLTRCVDFHFWKTKQGEVTGVTINFETADDFHYELEIGEWIKFAAQVFREENLENTVQELKAFLKGKRSLFALENALVENNIQFKKISFS